MNLDELAQRAVLALHLQNHARLTKPTFMDCREGLCGDYHALLAKREGERQHESTHCAGCDMPREQCVCECQ